MRPASSAARNTPRIRKPAATASSGHPSRSRAARRSAPTRGAAATVSEEMVDMLARPSPSLDLRSCSTTAQTLIAGAGRRCAAGANRRHQRPPILLVATTPTLTPIGAHVTRRLCLTGLRNEIAVYGDRHATGSRYAGLSCCPFTYVAGSRCRQIAMQVDPNAGRSRCRQISLDHFG